MPRCQHKREGAVDIAAWQRKWIERSKNFNANSRGRVYLACLGAYIDSVYT
jgi:hypothetical protein